MNDLARPFMPPSEAELASLAATIATGKETADDDFLLLAERALALWFGAAQALKDRKDRAIIAARARTREEFLNTNPFRQGLELPFAKAGIEPPKPRFHYTFTKALCYVMPKKSQADRVKFFRDYLNWLCEFDPVVFDLLSTPSGRGPFESIVEIPPDQDADAAMTRSRESGFDHDQFVCFAERFLPWIESLAKHNRAEAGRAGGKARAANKKAKAAVKKREC